MLKELEIFKKELQPYTDRAYFVGGCVRDEFLSRACKDIDIEVFDVEQETLEKILNICAEKLGFKEVELVGKQYGIYKLGELDISIPRIETKTGDKHTDFECTLCPTLPVVDAQRRRDFTVNAIYKNIFDGSIVDSFNGISDMSKRVIKHIDDKTFIEDALRVFRAARFSSVLDFEISEETKALCKKINLSALPTERIVQETSAALIKSDTPSVYFKTLQEIISDFDTIFGDIDFSEIDSVVKDINIMYAFLYKDADVIPDMIKSTKQRKLIELSRITDEVQLFKVFLKDREVTKQYTILRGIDYTEKFSKIKAPTGSEIMKKYSIDKPSAEVGILLEKEYKELLKEKESE
jgi:tRNA nucleotidyltransferase (CCA-adding enzyme)